MSEYFGNYKRPKEEIKEIKRFITIFNKSKKEYKLKNYDTALSNFISSYNILLDIFDISPKVITLSYIIKILFRQNQYKECYSYIENIKQFAPYLIEEKKEYFVKYYPKVFLYEFILDFIHEKLDESILHITELISYLKNDTILTLEEKVKFYFIFLKNFIKLGENVHSRNFLFFKEQYFSMIVEEKINKKYEKPSIGVEKKISNSFVTYYKTYMNSKLKESIFEKLDKLYYTYKYGIFNDKIISFLNRNIEPYVQSGEKKTLIKKLENYLSITKIDLNQEFKMDMNQLIYEQKIRIKCFNSTFLNIVGGFNQIFRNYYTNNYIVLQPLKKSNSTNYLLDKKDIQFMNEKIVQNKTIINYVENSRKINEKRKKKLNKNLTIPNFNNEIKVPPPSSLGLKLNKNKNNSKLLFFSGAKYKTIFNRSYRVSKIVNTKSYNSNIKNSSNINKKIIFPVVNQKRFLLKKEDIFYHKLFYRRINYFLISKFVEIYESFFYQKNERKNTVDKKEKTKYILEDSLLDLNIINSIKEISFKTLNGDIEQDIFHNSFFIFKRFILINNFYLLGICESKGKFSDKISKTLSILFPAFLNYLIIEYFLSKEKKDFESLILQLIKLEELTNNIKGKFLLSYLYEKLKINFRNFSSLSNDLNLISNFVYESLFYIIKEFIQKYKYELNQSSINLCSVIILGKILYLINVGNNTEALICNKSSEYNSNNEWTYQSLSSFKTNKINKKIYLVNNIEIINTSKEISKENNNDILSFKLNDKKSLLFDTINNEKGIYFEEHIVKYNLNINDRFIIIASFGFWKYMNNEETVDIIGKYYDNGMTSEQAAKLLIEIAENKCLEEYKQKPSFYNGKENNEFDDISCIIIYLNA